MANSVVRLGDIARVDGTEPADRLDALRSLVICAAPPPSESQLLSVHTVAAALLASGADLSKLTFGGANEVHVVREYDLIDAEELRSAFARFVSARTGWEMNSFLVQPPKNFLPIVVPPGNRRIMFDVAPNEDFRGSVLAHVLISIEDEPSRQVSHRFRVDRYVQALVTTRKIPRGHIVSEADVKIEMIEQTSLDEETFTKPEQAVGLMAERTAYPGTVLTPKLLTAPPVIERGQYAAVVWEGSGFSVSTRGRVLEDGSEDEVVRVRLPSRKIVRARVVDAGTVVMASQGEVDGALK
ncbi:MAG: hypothetical protein Kow0099_31890 [Candidatus Abyssubacteria bacterium]